MVKVSPNLLSFKGDQLFKRYFCGVQRFISKLPLHILYYAQVCQGQVIGIRVTCTAYFSDMAFKQFPLCFICKTYCGNHWAKLIIKSHNSTFRQLTIFENSNYHPAPKLTADVLLSFTKWILNPQSQAKQDPFKLPLCPLFPLARISALSLLELRICLPFRHLFPTTSIACNWMLQQRKF